MEFAGKRNTNIDRLLNQITWTLGKSDTSNTLAFYETDYTGSADRRQVDAVARDVFAVDYYVAQVDPDAVSNAVRLRNVRFPLRHGALRLHSTLNGVDYAWELDQQAVARCFDDAPAELRDLWVDQFAVMGLLTRNRMSRL